MKKIITIVTALALALSIASCKKTANESSNGTVANGTGTTAATIDNKNGEFKVEHTIEGEYLVFKIYCKIAIEQDAWCGICTKGNYILEDDADDAEFSYAYFEERDSEEDPYCFKVAFNDMDDGEYTVVLCNTDNSGYVVASWNLTLKSSAPSIDYSNLRVNQKPANLKPPEDPAYQDDDEDDDDDDEDDYDYPGDDGGSDDANGNPDGDGDYDEEPDDGADDA